MAAQSTPIQTEQPDPSQYDAGYFEHQLREAMADMRRFRSVEGLRDLTAEILNEMADGKRNHG